MGRLSVNRVLVALLCAAFPTLAGIGLPMAVAQTDASYVGASSGGLAQDRAPQPGIIPRALLEVDEPDELGRVLPGVPPFGSGMLPRSTAPGPLDVIRGSIFGAASADDWHPLSLSTFFTDGWDRPYVKSPEGTRGAPKQNWFGSADGIFSRQVSVDFFYTNGMTANEGLLLSPFPWAPVKPNTTGNQYWASCNLYLPLNQRMELLVVAPFIAANTTSPNGNFSANFGDLTLSARFRLVEQRNFTLQTLLTERTPTGQTVNGNDINYITPSVEFWWNFAPEWVFRAGTGINIDTGRTSATDTYMNNVAIGRYLTSKDAPIFRRMVAHVAVATMTDLLGRKDHITEVYIAPGIQFALDRDRKWVFLAAIQIPVAAPQPYAFQPDFGLTYNY
jgi:hypothetical protein